MSIYDKYKFYLILAKELICLPFLIPFNYYKFRFGRFSKNEFVPKRRKPVANKGLLVGVHEWGGYSAVRKKKINEIKEFECGLQFQLERFENYEGKHDIDIWITISDADLLNYSLGHRNILKVSNAGMDFSGYNSFFNLIKQRENQYVLLTNSSVNSLQVEFIDDYIAYMDSNPGVGLLGVSYNTKIHQTLIRNNFSPHLQSFFLLTTIDVLNEIVVSNGQFPGSGIDHKLLLIREGEAGLSNLVLSLDYDLACVLESGEVYKFNKSCTTDNGRKSWAPPMGDYRLHTSNPNCINSISIND